MSTTVTINGMEWSVYFVDKSYPALTDDSGTQDAYGVAHFRTCDIYIDCGLPKELMRQTVMHELVHALRFSYGESIDLESEEKICDFIAAHFDELKSLRKAVLKAL